MIKRFFFLLLVGTMGFFSSKGVAAKLDPESHAELSDLGYAKHIEVKCYLVTREQVAQIFNQKNEVVIQLSNDKLPLNGVYLLVRCKNNGSYRAFWHTKLLYS